MNTNLLDLNNDVLNIIGDDVKKNIFKRKNKIKEKNNECRANHKRKKKDLLDIQIGFLLDSLGSKMIII
jgi:hypothetical protein